MANSLNPAIAGLMGRGDLSRRGSVVQLDVRRVNSDAPGFGDDSLAQVYGAGTAGDVNTGRISLGTLGLVVLGLGGFYLWTRSHQA
jgi:hypothetical protein